MPLGGLVTAAIIVGVTATAGGIAASAASTAAHDVVATQQGLGNAQLQQQEELARKQLQTEALLAKRANITGIMGGVAQAVTEAQLQKSNAIMLEQKQQQQQIVVVAGVGLIILTTVFLLTYKK